jgi:hypothetical protein
MDLKSNDPFKSALGPLDLDTPFIAISKYHVENRVFRNCSHSVSIAAFHGACKTDRVFQLSAFARQTMSEGEHAAVSDEHCQHAHQREAEEEQ